MKKKKKKLKKNTSKNQRKTKKKVKKTSKKSNKFKIKNKSVKKINNRRKQKKSKKLKQSRKISKKFKSTIPKKPDFLLKVVNFQNSLKPEFKFRLNFGFEKYVQAFFSLAPRSANLVSMPNNPVVFFLTSKKPVL